MRWERQMGHNEIFKQYNSLFPIYSGSNAKMWFPNGKNCIRVRLNNNQEFIFTYNDVENWKLETTKSYIKSIG